MSDDDELVRKAHEAAFDLAALARATFLRLTESGFTEEQALQLAVALMSRS